MRLCVHVCVQARAVNGNSKACCVRGRLRQDDKTNTKTGKNARLRKRGVTSGDARNEKMSMRRMRTRGGIEGEKENNDDEEDGDGKVRTDGHTIQDVWTGEGRVSGGVTNKRDTENRMCDDSDAKRLKLRLGIGERECKMVDKIEVIQWQTGLFEMDKNERRCGVSYSELEKVCKMREARRCVLFILGCFFFGTDGFDSAGCACVCAFVFVTLLGFVWRVVHYSAVGVYSAGARTKEGASASIWVIFYKGMTGVSL